MTRLDKYLVEKGFAVSRERARMVIESGGVSINGITAVKLSQPVTEKDLVNYSDPLQFVSRGGLKLQRALTEFRIECTGKRVLDIGASTGGFTDCVLQNGAEMVYAVDVGKDQLHPDLRKHPRVKSMEETDIRDLQLNHLDGTPCDLIVADLSFISLHHILSLLNGFLQQEGKLIMLIKPQFEAGREGIGKGGIVKDPRIHERIIGDIFAAAPKCRIYPEAVCFAPIVKGKNIEYLFLAGKNPVVSPEFRKVVESAFQIYRTL